MRDRLYVAIYEVIRDSQDCDVDILTARIFNRVLEVINEALDSLRP